MMMREQKSPQVAAMGVRPRPPSQTAYYVALGGIIALLVMLLVYFACFCVKRVKELVQQDSSLQTHISARPPPPTTTTYPVQPVVRDSASAMAKLCRQLPAPTPVYPSTSSPEAARAAQGPPSRGPAVLGPSSRGPSAPPPPPPGPGKTPAPPAATIPRIEIDTIDSR